ncbi:MAG TPA: hypothetical protein PLB14_03790 [Smithellaceae bacterium]|jgi:type IV secretory pathway VirB4 component|nr:hypothetical protein [Syntrophaceae bacterium]HPV48804.1 hypothetical protein [Smithellaceae bacterium]
MARAIDLQSSILQTSVTERVQQIQQQHADMQQRYFQLKLSEEDRLAREKIREFEEAEKAKLRRKEQRQDHQSGFGQQMAKDMPAADDDDEDPLQGGHVNIKV